MRKPHRSLQVCYLCHQKARPGSGITDAKGRKHKVCPRVPTAPLGSRFTPAETQEPGIAEEEPDAISQD